MAGFVILFEPGTTSQARAKDFHNLLQLTAHFKQLDLSFTEAEGRYCTAAKLDAPSSIHQGIVHDKCTGSWILAAGTIVSLTGENDPRKILSALLQDYLDIGEKVLERYDGHFALVIYNGVEENLSVISDPTGQFSIFYGSHGDRTFFSTSAFAIAMQVCSQPDTLAIESFLRAGKAHGDWTLWQDVKRIFPGTVKKIDRDKVSEVEYWTPSYIETIARLSFEEALEYALDMMIPLFNCVLQREGKVWADLTGGFDTRLTTMLMAKLGIPFIAYCVGPDDHPDVQIAKKISEVMEWEYQTIQMPDDWEQRQLDWLETALFKGDARLSVLGLASVVYGQRERSITSKVNVTGLGADEWREAAYSGTYLFNRGKTYAYDRLIDAAILSSIPVEVMRQDRTLEIRREWKIYLSKLASNYSKYPNVIKGNAMFVKFRYPSHGGSYLSASAGFMRALSPFCFKEPVNFALSLDYRWRLNYHYRFVRTLLEREDLILANIETTKGGPAIPMRLSNLRKFVPLWKPIISNQVEAATHRLFGRSIRLWNHPRYSTYPMPGWRKAQVNYAYSEGLLNPSKMFSGDLYNALALQSMVALTEKNHFEYGEFLDRVITVEMALRAVGTGLG